jgi:conjugal transfer mating pair stabilization protein TraN
MPSLTVRKVENAKPGRHVDGAGLMLYVQPTGAKSWVTVTGAQGRCVPLPLGNASAGRYFATCNTGFSATEETRSCAVALNVTVSIQTNYIYWCNESPFNQENGTDDCALYAGPQCRQTGSRPGRCLQWSENGGRPYCVEPGEPISVITCAEQIPSGSLRSTTQSNTVNIARDESGCTAIAAEASCVQSAEICTDSDPVTRIVGGISVTQPCWAWTRDYLCRSVTTVQDCMQLEATPGCTLAREDCLTDEPCQTWERVFDCPLPQTPSATNQYICDGDVYCIDGSCETIEREANDEFKDAVVALNGMDQARREFDPNTLTLFKGQRGTCSSKVFGGLNCCKGKGFPLIPGISLLVALGCNSQELLLHERDAQGLCAYVGSYCSDSVLGVCLTKKKAYCCFESKLSRILQEQGRQQLNKPWGKPKTESCVGFTIDEFARLDLSQMDFSEVYAEFTAAARLPDEMQAAQDIQQKIEDYYATHGN